MEDRKGGLKDPDGWRGKYGIQMWDNEDFWKEPLEIAMKGTLWQTFDDPDEAVRVACDLTDECRLAGVSEQDACVFWAYDDKGHYLGGDTYEPGRPRYEVPKAKVLPFDPARRSTT